MLVESNSQSETVLTHSLTIEIGPTAATSLVRLSGELDCASAPTLEGHLQRLLGGNADRVIVDLDDLTFIDSTGLNALLAATRRSHGSRDQLRIIEPVGQVARVFRLANLDQVLPILRR